MLKNRYRYFRKQRICSRTVFGIGRWGRMHRDYIKEHNPIRFNDLCLSGELWTYLADLQERRKAQSHYDGRAERTV